MGEYIVILNILARYKLITNTNINCFYKYHPLWFLRNYSYKLTKEQLEYCVNKEPWIALEYAADRLSKDQFGYCVNKKPFGALKYASYKLSKEQLEYCVNKEPFGALKYAADRLSKEQLEFVKRSIDECL